MIDNETLDTMLWKKVSRIKQELNFTQIKAIADLFAHIVDYKSPFTSNHSIGVAEGAEKYQDLWDLMRISVRKCILPELCMT